MLFNHDIFWNGLFKVQKKKKNYLKKYILKGKYYCAWLTLNWKLKIILQYKKTSFRSHFEASRSNDQKLYTAKQCKLVNLTKARDTRKIWPNLATLPAHCQWVSVAQNLFRTTTSKICFAISSAICCNGKCHLSYLCSQYCTGNFHATRHLADTHVSFSNATNSQYKQFKFSDPPQTLSKQEQPTLRARKKKQSQFSGRLATTGIECSFFGIHLPMYETPRVRTRGLCRVSRPLNKRRRGFFFEGGPVVSRKDSIAWNFLTS